ncbi:MAG: hypothetical protein V3R66_03145 [Rhodospirillales bacterium]
MNSFFTVEIAGFPIKYALPFLIAGSVFLFVLYSFGLRELFKIPGEVKERRRREEDEIKRLAGKRRRGQEKPVSGLKRSMGNPLRRWIAQGFLFLLFGVFIGSLSDTLVYDRIGPDEALVKLSMTLPGKHKEKCRPRTIEENAGLPPQLRPPMHCPRERWPVLVELKLDGRRIFRETADPIGLSGDGQSSFYRTFKVPAGRHRMFLGIRDRGDGEGFNYVLEKDVDLVPVQVMVFTYNTINHTIYIK